MKSATPSTSSERSKRRRARPVLAALMLGLGALPSCSSRARCVVPYAIAGAALAGSAELLATNIGMAKAEAEHQLSSRPSGSTTQIWQYPIAVSAGAASGALLGYGLCD